MFTIIVLKSMIGETENAIDAICGWPRFLKNLSFDLKNIRLNSKTIKQLHLLRLPIMRLEGTKSVILSGPPCKDGNARFSTVPWKNVEDTNNRYSVSFYEFLPSHFCRETANEN